MNEALYQKCQELRRSSRWSPATRRRVEQLNQKAGLNPNRSPEAVEAEMEKRLLVGNKNLSDLDWRGIDTRKIQANTDDIIARGVTTDSKTVLGRAVDIKLDGSNLKPGTKIVGDINGGSATRAYIRGVQASHINRNGFDISGSITGENDFSFGSSIGWTQVGVNSVGDSHVKSNLSKAVFAGGWLTQGYLDGSTISFGKILNTGLANTSFDDAFGYKAEIRPKNTDELPSARGATFVECKLNTVFAGIAEEGSATLKRCTIVHDDPEPEAESEMPAFTKRFAALEALHKPVAPAAYNDNGTAVRQPRRPSLRMPTPSMGLLLGLAA